MLDVEKEEFCANITCIEDKPVCGFRTEGEGFGLKLFENECELLKYGCLADEEKAYGLINKEYCETSTDNFNDVTDYTDNGKVKSGEKLSNTLFHKENNNITCNKKICIDKNEVCGIRKDGAGYIVRLFESECEMDKYNCENNMDFTVTDVFICLSEQNNADDDTVISNGYKRNIANLVVINSNILGDVNNINDSIDTFFAASHVFDLPLKEVQTLDTRRRLVKYAGPVNVFVPWIVKPKNISNDTFHIPTLSSCYHRCPTKCPDTYAPVCGVPGILAREPSIMFQNHCFMDVAQCKMFWENRSSTAHSSSYLEASFLFCMGDEMNSVYRFLPAIRTLQHMGRLKKKGKFRAKLRNFRHLTHFRSGQPKFMG